jgi:hypothetical protein
MKIEIEIKSDAVISYLDKHEFKGSLYDSEINRLLEIGVAVVERVEVNRDVEFVQKEVEKMLTQFNTNLGKLCSEAETRTINFVDTNFDAGEKDSYTAKFIEYMRNGLKEFKTDVAATTKLMLDNAREVSTDKISEVKNALDITKESIVKFQQALSEQTDFNKIDSFPNKMLKETEKYFGKESPLVNVVQTIVNSFSNDINNSIISLREELARKEGSDEMLKQTVVKGLIFEEEIDIRLGNIAKSYSDIVTMVGTEKEKGNQKKGDFIYKFNGGDRIVIECKDSSVGLKPMLDYMNLAMENRSVDFGILLTKTADQLPNQVGVFNLYENKLFCSAEYLEFAIRWTRLYLAKIKSVEKIEGINKNVIEDKLKGITAELKNLVTVKKKLTSVTNFITSENTAIAEVLEKMRQEISNHLEQLEEEIK